jgi:hypothetical protein
MSCDIAGKKTQKRVKNWVTLFGDICTREHHPTFGENGVMNLVTFAKT